MQRRNRFIIGVILVCIYLLGDKHIQAADFSMYNCSQCI